MTAQDAFDEWMAHDEWQFADREACWKFMFEKGKESMRQQLAAAIAACRLKDEALQNCEGMLDELRDYPITHDAIIEALAIQPDDSALKAWLGEQSGWTHSCPVLCLDGVELWIDRCPHCGRPAPKGLK